MTAIETHAAEATGAGLMRFLDKAIKDGNLKVPTGQAMKTACKEILSATRGADWEQTDLASLDLDDTLRRFETLRAMKFSSGSLNTYKSRFAKSLSMFNGFLADPGAWRPDVKTRTRVAPRGRTVLEPNTGKTHKVLAAVGDHLTQSASNVITYPFPLRTDVLVALQLPSDLTFREAKRLSGFIESLAVDDQPALPAGQA